MEKKGGGRWGVGGFRFLVPLNHSSYVYLNGGRGDSFFFETQPCYELRVNFHSSNQRNYLYTMSPSPYPDLSTTPQDSVYS